MATDLPPGEALRQLVEQWRHKTENYSAWDDAADELEAALGALPVLPREDKRMGVLFETDPAARGKQQRLRISRGGTMRLLNVAIVNDDESLSVGLGKDEEQALLAALPPPPSGEPGA